METMGKSNDDGALDAISVTCLAFLARLARRGAYAVVQEGAEIDPEIALFETLAAARTRVGMVPWSAFDQARTAGYLERDVDDFGWCLSATGRTILRRARTRQAQARALCVANDLAPATPTPRRNDAESPLAWLHHRLDKAGKPLVDAIQFDAGERLRADLFFAQMTPRVTSSWSDVPQSSGSRAAPGAGLDMSDFLVAARQRVSSAIDAVGPDLAGILIDVCGHLQGLEAIERREKWPQRSAKLVLQKALNALARHYGLLAPESAVSLITRRSRHWGAQDFRPRIDRALPAGNRL